MEKKVYIKLGPVKFNGSVSDLCAVSAIGVATYLTLKSINKNFKK